MKRKKFIIAPGRSTALRDFDPDDTSGYTSEADAQAKLQADMERLCEQQERLYASDRFAVLIVLQGMDTAGKDGIVEHVMSGLNPQGVDVHAFKQPSQEELNHDFLWRCIKVLPERGRIGIFNRSYYEEVVVARVKPEVLQAERLPAADKSDKIWRQRFHDICDFEEYLLRNGTVVLKFFLHISKAEQRRRLLQRLTNPDKNWKFSATDLATHKDWKRYRRAYEEMLPATSTKNNPWYIIPSNKKWAARVVVADIIVRRLMKLDLDYPRPDTQQRREIKAALSYLQSEG